MTILSPLSDSRELSVWRRKFLKVIGGAIIVPAAAGLPGCSAEIPPEATIGWRGPGNETDVRRWLLSFALLAPIRPSCCRPCLCTNSVGCYSLWCGDAALATSPAGIHRQQTNYRAIHRLCGAVQSAQTVQMWARVGYSREVPQAPRRALDEIVRF